MYNSFSTIHVLHYQKVVIFDDIYNINVSWSRLLSYSHLYLNKLLSAIHVPSDELSSKALFDRSFVFKREHPEI